VYTDRSRADLAEFLRNRRLRITPEQAGLPTSPNRRTPGLRREEVAVLAGISPTWYTYLEQGRDIHPSAEVLDALARVLHLTDDEHAYLHLLANGQGPPVLEHAQGLAGERYMARIVELFAQAPYPVFAGNIYTDITCWNPVTTTWYADFAKLPPRRRNMLWWLFTDPIAQERLLDWADEAKDITARLRIAAASRPWDRNFNQLVDELQTASPEFRTWWARHDVRDDEDRVRRICLPDGTIHIVNILILRTIDTYHSLILHLPHTQAGAGEASFVPMMSMVQPPGVEIHRLNRMAVVDDGSKD
jgi:transcriptional regulator with XRE-family HTH domain